MCDVSSKKYIVRRSIISKLEESFKSMSGSPYFWCLYGSVWCTHLERVRLVVTVSEFRALLDVDMNFMDDMGGISLAFERKMSAERLKRVLENLVVAVCHASHSDVSTESW